MNKTIKFYGIIFLVILVILGILEINKKEVLDWRKNYEITEKTPFGLYVFNQEAEHLFNKKLKRVKESPFNYYGDKKSSPHNILIIQKDIDHSSWYKLMNQVQQGSDAMIISSEFPRDIADSLRFNTSEIYFGDTNILSLTDEKFLDYSILIDKLPTREGFMYVDKEHEILGKTSETDNTDQASFIKINFGKGHFYMHSEPLFLTNYYLLKPRNQVYAQNVFSYLPDRETVWFLENKNATQGESPSYMRFILSHEGLRYAWYLFLLGLLIFIFFNAKRKQRIVPIIEPLKNKSVEFVKSVGNLYLQEGDFHDMMAKKAQYFLHRVRLDFLIDTQNLDDAFAKKLQLKTGKDLGKINEAISLIKRGQNPYAHVTKEDLIKMNTLLDEILR